MMNGLLIGLVVILVAVLVLRKGRPKQQPISWPSSSNVPTELTYLTRALSEGVVWFVIHDDALGPEADSERLLLLSAVHEPYGFKSFRVKVSPPQYFRIVGSNVYDASGEPTARKHQEGLLDGGGIEFTEYPGRIRVINGGRVDSSPPACDEILYDEYIGEDKDPTPAA